MKKICIASLAVIIFSCSSNEKKVSDESKTKIETGVQNVNGNVPDTTNSINLSTQKQKDSIKK